MNPSEGSVPSRAIEARVEGMRLPGRAWCRESPHALIAIVHGIGEHSGRYAALASDLVVAGYSVVCLDLPGHGEAPGPRGDFRWLPVRDQIVPAMFTANLGLPGQPDRLPRVLLGHSMGGLIALDYALAHSRDLERVVASSPGLRSAIPPWWKLALANVARVTAPATGFPTGLDTTGISHDPEVCRLREADPLKHDLISPRLYFGLAEARQRVLREARRLHVPALLLHGEADRLVDVVGSREFAAAAPAPLARLITYPDGWHEMFNDRGREQVIRDVVAWLARGSG